MKKKIFPKCLTESSCKKNDIINLLFLISNNLKINWLEGQIIHLYQDLLFFKPQIWDLNKKSHCDEL